MLSEVKVFFLASLMMLLPGCAMLVQTAPLPSELTACEQEPLMPSKPRTPEAVAEWQIQLWFAYRDCKEALASAKQASAK